MAHPSAREALRWTKHPDHTEAENLEDPPLADNVSEAKEADKTDSPEQAVSMMEIMYRLRNVIILMWLSVLQMGVVQPSILYISTSFFAGPGNDCEATPDSPECRRGATELAFWKGILQGVSQSVAWLFALTLGSYSDKVGRRPLFRMKAVLSLVPIISLALHEFFRVSLWGYLISSVIYRAFDTNGVMLAIMSDVVHETHLRATAYAFLLIAFVVGALAVMALGLLPADLAVTIALAASVLKVVYVEFAFPETAKLAVQGSSDRSFSCIGTAKQAAKLFMRHSFILRMAIILVTSGLAAAGLSTVTTPIMTGYLSVTKDQGILIALVAGLSALVGLCLVKPLSRFVGEVNTLRVCLAASALYPLLLSQCTSLWHMIALNAALTGPIILQFPVMSAIKTNLVGDDEQGLVQGTLAAVRVVAVAAANIFFGWFFRWTTEKGEGPQSSTFPSLAVITALSACGFAIVCTLPSTLPPLPEPMKTADPPGPIKELEMGDRTPDTSPGSSQADLVQQAAPAG